MLRHVVAQAGDDQDRRCGDGVQVRCSVVRSARLRAGGRVRTPRSAQRRAHRPPRCTTVSRNPGACVRQWSAKWRAVAIFARRKAASPSPARELPGRGDVRRAPSCAPPQTIPASSRNGTAPASTVARIRRGTGSRRSVRPLRARRGPCRSRVPMAARSSCPGRRERALRFAHRGHGVGERLAAIARDLAADEVVRLDAGGALVDRGDPRVAQVLRGARLLDVAHAAVHLHAERGHLLRHLGAPALDDRDHQLGEGQLALARVGASG